MSRVMVIVCDRCGVEARDLNEQATFTKGVEVSLGVGKTAVGDLCKDCYTRLYDAVQAAIRPRPVVSGGTPEPPK